jgi:competence protein ComEC
MERAKPELDIHGLTLVLIACAWLAGILLAAHITLPIQLLVIGVLASLLLLLPLWHDRQGRLILFLTCCLLLGAWRYTSALPINDSGEISNFIGEHSLKVQGTVSEAPRLWGYSRVLVTANKVSRDNGASWQDVHGKILVQTRERILDTPYGAQYGDTVELQGKLQSPEHSHPGIFTSMAFPRLSIRSAGGNTPLALLYHLRLKLAQAIERSLPQPEAAILIALFLSMRTPGLRPLTEAFNVTGTAHLIAPSGFKVTILAGLISNSLLWLSGRKSYEGTQKYRGWQQWFITPFILTTIAAYTILSGAGAAAIRSGIMGALLVLAPRIGRTYNIYTSLSFAALVMSIIDPFILWDVGFQLSFLGTVGIVLMTPFFQRMMRRFERLPTGHYLVENTAVTLAAQTATLPIFAVAFGQLSFISPLANMLTVPLLGITLILGLLVSGLSYLFAPLGTVMSWIAWPVCWYVGNIVVWCANLPGAYITVDGMENVLAWAYYILLALVIGAVMYKLPSETFFFRRKHSTLSSRRWHLFRPGAALLIVLATGITILFSTPSRFLTITFLDALDSLHGQATLVRTPEGKTLLIDGGPDPIALSQALDSKLPPWQRSLDMVLLTTSGTNRITGLQDIINRYQVGTVVDAGMLHPDTTYTLWRRTISERGLLYVQVAQRAMIPVSPQVSLQVLWPARPLHKSNDEARDNGLIIRLVAPGLSVLFLGASAQSKYALRGLLASIDTPFLQADIVQIMGEANRPYPVELDTLLQRARPVQLIITPARMQQYKQGDRYPTLPVPAGWQAIQTAQHGPVEIRSDTTGWHLALS